MSEFETKHRNYLRFLNIGSVLLVQVIGIGINFFLSPYISRTIGESAYGFIALANNFTSYASLITIALNSMAIRFIVIALHQNNPMRANQYYSSALIANVIMSVLFLAVGGLFVSRLDILLNVPSTMVRDVKLLFAFVFIAFIITTATSVFSVSYYVIGRMYVYNLRSLESTFLRLTVIVILFTLLPARVFYMGLASLIATLYLMVFNLNYSRKRVPQLQFRIRDSSLSCTRELFSSGIWNSVNLLGTTLTEGLDLLIGNVFLGAGAMGILAFSKTIPNALRGLMSVIGSMYAPEVMHDVAKKDSTVINRTVKDSMKIMGCIMNAPISCFIGFGLAFYKLWLPMQNAKVLYLLSLLLLVETTFSTTVSPIYNVFSAENRLKVPSIAHVVTGLFSTVTVLVLLRTTNFGLFAIAGVSSIWAVIKLNCVILPFGSKVLGSDNREIRKYSILSASTIWIIGAIGFLLAYLSNVDKWYKLIAYGFAFLVVAFIVNVRIWFSRQERDDIWVSAKALLRKN